MFKVDLDHALYFVPPMDEHAGGIIVTRTLELPFAPSPGLMVFGKEMDECPEPMGFKLGDLVWDMDRQVFLAKTSTVYDSPIALVPYEIRGWIDRGWRFGSYLDLYPQEDEPKTRSKMLKELVARDGVPDFDDDEMDRWPALPPAARPGHFNETFGSLVRMMAELHNNSAIAYAMDKTKRFYSEEDIKKSDSPIVRKWRNLAFDFDKLPVDRQIAWRDRVTRKYVAMERIVANL